MDVVFDYRLHLQRLHQHGLLSQLPHNRGHEEFCSTFPNLSSVLTDASLSAMMSEMTQVPSDRPLIITIDVLFTKTLPYPMEPLEPTLRKTKTRFKSGFTIPANAFMEVEGYEKTTEEIATYVSDKLRKICELTKAKLNS